MIFRQVGGVLRLFLGPNLGLHSGLAAPQQFGVPMETYPGSSNGAKICAYVMDDAPNCPGRPVPKRSHSTNLQISHHARRDFIYNVFKRDAQSPEC